MGAPDELTRARALEVYYALEDHFLGGGDVEAFDSLGLCSECEPRRGDNRAEHTFTAGCIHVDGDTLIIAVARYVLGCQ